MSAPQRSPDPPLFQERLRTEPFWMVVGCLLVNRASWARAAEVHAQIRRLWPTAHRLAAAPPETLSAVVFTLGFAETRWERVRNFARHWVANGPPGDANELLTYPGCGAYARDAWAIFVEGRRDVRPTDWRLRQYLARPHV